MTGKGYVEKTEGGFAYVLCVRESACGESCVHCKMCRNRGARVLAKNGIGAKEGDNVEVFADTGKIIFIAFMLYVLPVILLFSAVVLSQALESKRLFPIFAAAAALVWFFAIKILGKNKVTHTITEVICHRD